MFQLYGVLHYCDTFEYNVNESVCSVSELVFVHLTSIVTIVHLFIDDVDDEWEGEGGEKYIHFFRQSDETDSDSRRV